jgi:hypothetical protein
MTKRFDFLAVEEAISSKGRSDSFVVSSGRGKMDWPEAR